MEQLDEKQKESLRFTLIFVGVICGAVSVFLSLHCAMSDEMNFFVGLMYGVPHILSDPLDIVFKPLFFWYLLIFAAFTFILETYVYTDTVERSKVVQTPWKAKFYEDINDYNKKFVDTKNQFNNIILTETIKLSMNSSKTQRNNNVLVIGGSGAGKTRYMIKPNILQANCSYVITDPKGEILQSEGEMLKKKGYKIKVFNLVDMEHSNSYNPFEYIRDDPGVLMMINCLIKNTNNGQKGGDPFWEKSETALLQALVFYLKDNKEISKEFKNFSNVMKLLRAAEVDENNPDAQSPLDKLFAKVEDEDPNSLAVKQYKTFKMGAGKTLKSILISCAVRLTTFNLPAIADLTMEDDLELSKVGDEKTALFVVIPAADDTYNFLVSMMYSQLFETLYYHAENECPYQYYIKEGNDVLAIAEKDPRGDKYTERKAERLLTSLRQRSVTTERVNGKTKYVLKTKDFKKEFYDKEAAEEYKKKLEKATIVKGSIRLPYPVRFLLDEFANIGQIPDFTKKLATMRQYEISCTIILQNMAQIKNLYKDDYGSIIGNCDSFLFLGGQEVETLEYVSKLLGKKTITTKSKGESSSSKGKNSSKNLNIQGIELMSVDELSTMPTNMCVLIIRGLDPFYTPKYNLSEHPNYPESGDYDDANRFDCKTEIFNAGALRRQSQTKVTAADTSKAVSMYTSKSQTFDQVIKSNGIKNSKEAVERVTLKKGEVIVNEKENTETGKFEFDYNLYS